MVNKHTDNTFNLSSILKCKFAIPSYTFSTEKKLRNLTKANTREDMVEQDLFKIASGNVNWANHFRNNLALSHKVEYLPTLQLNNYTYTCTYIYIQGEILTYIQHQEAYTIIFQQ